MANYVITNGSSAGAGTRLTDRMPIIDDREPAAEAAKADDVAAKAESAAFRKAWTEGKI